MAAKNARCSLFVLEDNGNHDSMSSNTHDSTHDTTMDTNQCTTSMQYNIEFLDLQAANSQGDSSTGIQLHTDAPIHTTYCFGGRTNTHTHTLLPLPQPRL